MGKESVGKAGAGGMRSDQPEQNLVLSQARKIAVMEKIATQILHVNAAALSMRTAAAASGAVQSPLNIQHGQSLPVDSTRHHCT
jgi:hypothetical protein